MDIKIIVDKQSELRMNEAAEKLEQYCKNNNIKSQNKETVVVFSNDYNFVKDIAMKFAKNTIVINVTENLSEQHIINVIKCVSEICYLKTDVNTIATRIINTYNKNKVNVEQRV